MMSQSKAQCSDPRRLKNSREHQEVNICSSAGLTASLEENYLQAHLSFAAAEWSNGPKNETFWRVLFPNTAVKPDRETDSLFMLNKNNSAKYNGQKFLHIDVKQSLLVTRNIWWQLWLLKIITMDYWYLGGNDVFPTSNICLITFYYQKLINDSNKKLKLFMSASFCLFLLQSETCDRKPSKQNESMTSARGFAAVQTFIL